MAKSGWLVHSHSAEGGSIFLDRSFNGNGDSSLYYTTCLLESVTTPRRTRAVRRAHRTSSSSSWAIQLVHITPNMSFGGQTPTIIVLKEGELPRCPLVALQHGCFAERVEPKHTTHDSRSRLLTNCINLSLKGPTRRRAKARSSPISMPASLYRPPSSQRWVPMVGIC